jgi:hypothetical protein
VPSKSARRMVRSMICHPSRPGEVSSADLATVLVEAGAIHQRRADSTGKAAERAQLVGKGPTSVSRGNNRRISERP